MINKRKYTILFCSILCLIFLNLFSLSAQKKGYAFGSIIRLNNDTINGQVRIQPLGSYASYVIFLYDNGVKMKYQPNKIKGFIIRGKYYKSFPFGSISSGNATFLKLIKSGKVNLYQDDRNPLYNGLNMAYYYLQKPNSDDYFEVEEKNFNKNLSEYFNDHKVLATKILNKRYIIEDIEKIVDDYNTTTSNEENINLHLINDFEEGYYITESKDTIKGFIKVQTEIFNCYHLKFKLKNGTETKLKPKNNIGAYKVGYKEFVKAKIPEPKYGLLKWNVFLRVLAKGKVSLYRYSYRNVSSGKSGFSDEINMGPSSSFEEIFFLKEEDEENFTEVNPLTFKADMSKYFSDNSELVNDIRKKTLRITDLKEIVNRYNAEFN